ncbi:ELP4 (YPL101W) [Zygosaccharomyces parabailii]|nr:ELP4 (YPL101W) [Zygosaccharomyces parabailii]CDH16870.1 related to Elongator complex protein 4 [Zygosaccharomyces bailii ISA1307]
MSFRKRGDVLRGGVNVGSDGSSLTGRVVPGRESPARKFTTDNITLPTRQLAKLGVKEGLKSDHPGVRPSPATSQQTTSTGSQDLDRLLGHMGLPLGSSLLVEEKTTTEFNSILCKVYAAQGIVHNRVEPTKIGNTHLIVVTLNHGFSKELPGVYKGSRKDVKRSKIAEEESKLTVQNLTEQAKPARQNDLKIAWRYKLTDEDSTKGINALPSEEYQKYSNQFDITTRLMPAPTPQEMSFVSPVQPSQTVLSQIERIITQNEGKLIRILVPSLLHPAMYPPPMFKLSGVIPLIHGLKGLVKKHQDRCVLLATLSSDMLSDLLVAQAENLFDAVLSLEPFEQDMLRFLEKAYKSQPNKVQHGLVHVLKLPVFSERGEMHVAKSEYAFKNGRKRFEIEEWGIPVEDEDDGALRTQNEIKNTEEAENSSRNTTISLDF